MKYLIFTDEAELETWRAKIDAAFGYPESLDKFRHVGADSYLSFDIGRALHYAKKVIDKDGVRMALPNVKDKDKDKEAIEVAAVPEKATLVEKLPDDWFEKDPMLDLKEGLKEEPVAESTR